MTTALEIPDCFEHLPDDDFFEIVDGELRKIEPLLAYDSLLASKLAFLLGDFAEPKRLGLVTIETLFVLRAEPLLERRPDIAFVSNERRKQHRIRRASAWDVVPDLAIEIVSSTNLADEIDAKLVDYFAAGVRQVWVIYPETRRLYVYESLQTARGHSEDDVIDAAPVLPGFTFRLVDLFNAIENIDDEP